MKTFRVWVALLLCLGSTPSLFAQGGYFGQNKVQYQEFDFKVLKTEHFDIYYYPEEEQAVRMASRMAERWYTRLSTLLDHELRGRQVLILYASGPHFRQTNAIQGTLGEGTGGVTEALKRRIVLPFAGPLEATDHVLGHELVHAFQYDITNTDVSSGNAGALALPLWFIEGMAEYLSIGPVDPHTSMWMREAARREKLPTIDELNNPKYFPYRYGQAVWAYIGGKYGDNVVGDMLRAGSGRNGTYQSAIESVLGIKTEELTKEWHGAVFESYKPIALTTRMPGQIARGVIPKEKGSALNVSPELSPDGTKVIFFSERDLFSIDLFVADARTGQVIRKITDTATDPHFESLQFLSSAGAWDQASKRFLFPGISKGQPVLTIVDVDRGKTEREIRLEGIDEVLNPAWSPDGQSVAFSGLVGGFNDLFVYDLKADTLRRLTTDPFAELDPAWSPDGRRLAFSTDRFTTNLTDIVAGDFRVAVMDVATGEVQQMGGFENAKNISPQWTPDGRSLYFLSDREGVTNIYRTEIGGETKQVTNLLTGVSGITALSPALSVAQGRVVFSAYEDDGYSIYALESEEQLAEQAPVSLPINAALLAPRRTPEGTVYAALQDAKTGLPPTSAENTPEEQYKPKLSIDYVGQPSVAVGMDPFGTYAAGGMSMVFSDMLGNHTLATGIQATNRLDEIGGSVVYINRKHRWNWGGMFDQTPYVLRGFEAGFTSIGGENVYVEREIRYLQTDRNASGIFSYPINRAQRIDLTGGFRQIGFKQDVRELIYDPVTGQQIGEQERDLGSIPSLNLGEASAALVYDTSINGMTSPIRGSRYRLELSQSAGSLTYSGVLGDFRTYLMPFRPFTLAFRGMFYGRFGRDSEDYRLPVLYLGYPGLVRGYDSGSFEAWECGGGINGSCPAYDRLIGSKVGIANAELRFPLWAAFGGGNFYGPLPVEMAFFTDAGVAWDGVTRPGFGPTDREPVVSVGAALRINVLNFAIAEIDFVRPLDRPGRGWLWQFSLRPGF